jgi:DNA (cytosine-5)-methyltransferase 1
MTLGSLFAGIGGIDLGFQTAGFTVAWQVEKDTFCRRVLAKHFPAADRSVTDVRDAGKHSLIPVDVIAGGDPCQRNSNAGRNGGGEASPAREFIRIVAELRPQLVLRENPAVTKADAPWPWWRFRDELERLEYIVFPFRFRSCCAGLDHERDRLFLLAALPDAYRTGLERNVREIVEGANGRGSNPNITGSVRRNPTPRICGRVDGIPRRMDRLKALGNAVAPEVAYQIAIRLREAINA